LEAISKRRQRCGKGGEGVGHEMKKGKTIAASKDMGEGVGKGVRKSAREPRKLSLPAATAMTPKRSSRLRTRITRSS